VHAHYGYSGAAAMGVHVPLVVSFCGDDLLARPVGDGSYTLKSRALIHLSRRAAHRADACIVKSEEMRRVIADVPGVHVIPNGVNIDSVRPQDQIEARKALGWREDGKVLLFAANKDEPRKNFPLAQAVERRLKDSGLDVRLEYLFGKPHATIITAMSAADVLLLPSFHEGSPNAVKEAMAVGLPVIVTDAGFCVDFVDDGREGFVLGLDPDSDVIQALEKLDRDPELAQRMGSAGRRRAERDYAADTLFQRYRALIAECAAA